MEIRSNSFLWSILILFCSVETSKDFKRETSSNQQGSPPGQGGLHRSFSTGDLDLLHRRQRPSSSHCNLNYHFDYFILALQWSSSFCLEKQECNLEIVRKKKWLIHGLWPSRYIRKDRDYQTTRDSISEPNLMKQNHIQFCCGPRYNSSLIKGNIYQELLDKWPTLHSNGKHHFFWQHEWQKHGTCARQINSLKNQLKYFETILTLYDKFNLNAALFKNGQSYKIQEVHQHIELRVENYKVRLECSLIDIKNITEDNGSNGSPNSRISIFSEVHICLNKQLNPINCPHRDDYQCKRSILFP